MSTIYVIASIQERQPCVLFWSNEDGWVDPRSATRFTEAQREAFNLPVGGWWLPVDREEVAV